MVWMSTGAPPIVGRHHGRQLGITKERGRRLIGRRRGDRDVRQPRQARLGKGHEGRRDIDLVGRCAEQLEHEQLVVGALVHEQDGALGVVVRGPSAELVTDHGGGAGGGRRG